MTFPTIPTSAAGRALTGVQANNSATRTFPSLSSLTKNSGDRLIAIVIGYQSSLTSNIFSSWGAGFTEFHDSGGSSQMCVGMAWKVSDGTETGPFTVTQGGTVTGHAALILLSIPGAHASTPPEAGSRAVGTSSAADPPSFDPAGWGAEDTLWICAAGCGETGTGGSFQGLAGGGGGNPTNYGDNLPTGISQDVVGGLEGAAYFRQLNTAAENCGPISPDTSNARNVAVMIAVRPAAALDVDGSGAPVEATDTPSASGTVTNVGSAAPVEAADTASAAGVVLVSGTAAVTEEGDAAAATGEVTAGDVTGSAAVSEEADLAQAAGLVTIFASASPSELADVAGASGLVIVAGVAAATEQDDAAAAAGLILENVTGSAAASEDDDQASASGTVAQHVTAAGAPIEADDAAAGAGHVEVPGQAGANVNDGAWTPLTGEYPKPRRRRVREIQPPPLQLTTPAPLPPQPAPRRQPQLRLVEAIDLPIRERLGGELARPVSRGTGQDPDEALAIAVLLAA